MLAGTSRRIVLRNEMLAEAGGPNLHIFPLAFETKKVNLIEYSFGRNLSFYGI